MSKKSIPKLHVIFDTNALFTQVASDLLNQSVKRVVEENSTHPDLNIQWFLPEVVIGERKFQMLDKAKDLLPALEKMERLLGHNLNINTDILEHHVDRAITASIEELGLQPLACDVAKVDWKNLIHRSVMRNPPFDAGEKEKGFRDAIIAQTFAQLHESSPSTPSVCKVALVCNDDLLKTYVEELTGNAKNVRMLSTLDELEGLINTLVSTVPEEAVTEYAKKAMKLFFEKGNSNTFYFKERIGDVIRDRFSEQLNNAVVPGSLRTDKTWWVMNPVFMKKEKQRIYWSSSIEVEFEIFHYEQSSPDLLESNPYRSGLASPPDLFGLGNKIGIPPHSAFGLSSVPPPPSTIMGRGLFGGGTKIVDGKGRDIFDVRWSTNLSQARNLTALRLEDIQHLGNSLMDERS